MEGKIDEAIALGEQNGKSHLATVLVSGLHVLRPHALSPEIPEKTIEAARRALERATAIGVEDLKRGLGGLATIGSVAPFVGLFGTTIGIINAFQGMRITVFSSPCPPSWPSTRFPTGSKPSRLRWTTRPPNFSIISYGGGRASRVDWIRFVGLLYAGAPPSSSQGKADKPA